MMDKVDFAILRQLQDDGRLTNVDLSERIHLSPSPCLRRVKKLEAESVITGYRATLDREKVGLGMTVFVDVSLENHKDQTSLQFEESIIAMPNVLSCFVVSGQSDYRLEVVVHNLKEYEAILRTIQTLPFVKDIHSNFAIRAVKTDAPLPIQEARS
ncbi:Lrp/AsnC family transcriptional regulator [Marinomonas ostreistagni]|nr:Lrp/AsnC family transcriptional regulator [Marinomonas ostreistagni]